MDEPFSSGWCEQLNEEIGESAAAADASMAGLIDEVVDARIEVLIRLRRPGSGEYRGQATITPRAAPFVVLGPYVPHTEFDVVIELPVQVLERISGKSVTDCGADPWIPAMLRVHKGMDVVMEMFYRHGYSSPIRSGMVPQLV